MTSHLHCQGCSRRIGRRARGLLVAATFVLCRGCADDPKIHRKVYNCSLSHSAREHGRSAVVSAGRAKQVLATHATD
jgi:hypothetical protein